MVGWERNRRTVALAFRQVQLISWLDFIGGRKAAGKAVPDEGDFAQAGSQGNLPVIPAWRRHALFGSYVPIPREE